MIGDGGDGTLWLSKLRRPWQPKTKGRRKLGPWRCTVRISELFQRLIRNAAAIKALREQQFLCHVKDILGRLVQRSFIALVAGEQVTADGLRVRSQRHARQFDHVHNRLEQFITERWVGPDRRMTGRQWPLREAGNRAKDRIVRERYAASAFCKVQHNLQRGRSCGDGFGVRKRWWWLGWERE